MTEKSKKLKKGIIREEDISTLLQRYTANTVLALLQEVAQFEGGLKIDWNALVKKSATGISNAREYQMLWRHLAYRQPLIEKLENGAQPLDDDSDLEYELEAFPDVSSEAAAEASACVKVLIASGLTSDSSHPNNAMVEAPLTINIPNGQLVKATSESSQQPTMRGMNITVPVSVQKQPQPAMASEALDTNGLVNGTIPPRRKRKPWTEAEDLELVAAVQKYGEGNWANILRSEFTWDRTASQLSQRWAIIRKRIGNLNLATHPSPSGVQITEAQRAAQFALNLALDPPVKNPFINSGEGTSSQHHSQRPFATKPSSVMQLGSAAKSQITVNKPAKPDLSSDPVRAAAVAAGARIASQSDAASLLRAAQAKNAIHIMPTIGSSVKSSLPSGASNHTEVHSNVNFNGVPTASISTLPVVSPSGLRPVLEKATSQSTQRNPISGTTTNVSSGQANAELPSKQDTVNTGGTKSLPNMTKVQVQEHRASVSGNEPSKQVKQEKAAVLSNQETKTKTQESVGERFKVSPKLEGDKVNCLSVEKDEKQYGGKVNGEEKGNLPRLIADKCGEKLEDVREKEPGDALTGGDS